MGKDNSKYVKCNSPSPPLADIVLFGRSFKVFKTRLLERGFHTLIKNVSFSSPTDVGSHVKELKFQVIFNSGLNLRPRKVSLNVLNSYDKAPLG